MANPATTARVAPTGIAMKGGLGTSIAFSLDSDICFWEVTVKPPAMDGGEPIDITTLFNTISKTKAPNELIEYMPIEITGKYDPLCYTAVKAIINQPGSATLHWPDSSKIDMFAYMKSFDPDPQEAGKDATFKATVIITNWDPVNNLEVQPVYTDAAGS